MAQESSLPRVLVLEITDLQVNALFMQMKRVINRQTPTSVIHITLRGPYSGDIPKNQLNNCRQLLQGTTIRIHAAGRFRNAREEVVFFRVDAPKLRELWWKPDYPIKHYGFQPHISVYRGKDAHFAQKLERFLSKEDVDIVISEYSIVTSAIGQRELFAVDYNEEIDFADLTKKGKVSPTLIKRLNDFMDQNARDNALGIIADL